MKAGVGESKPPFGGNRANEYSIQCTVVRHFWYCFAYRTFCSRPRWKWVAAGYRNELFEKHLQELRPNLMLLDHAEYLGIGDRRVAGGR